MSYNYIDVAVKVGGWGEGEGEKTKKVRGRI